MITLGDPAAAISVDGGMSYTNSEVMTGAGNLNATGAGTFAISGANNFTGQTFIQSGTVSVASVAGGGARTSLGVTPVVAIGTARRTARTECYVGVHRGRRRDQPAGVIGGGGGASI